MANKKRKSRTPRQNHRRLLVVTEGIATEKQYVERLNQFLRDAAVTVSVKAVGVGKDPREVVKKCVELRDPAKRDGKAYDQCLCLVDFDQHTTLAEAAGVARREGVAFLVSRLKFEVWLLWHVSDSCSAKTTKQLDELVARNKLLEKGKHLSPRFPIEKVGEATARAQATDPALCTGRVGPDPSSAMPVLVRLLNGESRRPF